MSSRQKKAPSIYAKCLFFLPNLVGATRFELATPTMSRWCSNQLSYAPVEASNYSVKKPLFRGAFYFDGFYRLRAALTPLTPRTLPKTLFKLTASPISTVKVIQAVPLTD